MHSKTIQVWTERKMLCEHAGLSFQLEILETPASSPPNWKGAERPQLEQGHRADALDLPTSLG